MHLVDGTYWGIGLSLGIETDSENPWTKSPVQVFNVASKNITSISLPDEIIIELDGKGVAALEIEPIPCNYKQISWTSSDSRIASINDNGVISAISIGQTNIEATVIDYNKSFNASTVVKVVEAGAGVDEIASDETVDYVTILDINGALIYKGERNSIPNLCKGIYIIKANSKVTKFIKL